MVGGLLHAELRRLSQKFIVIATCFFRIRRTAHASLVQSIRSEILVKSSCDFFVGFLSRWLEFVDNSMDSIHYVVDVKVYKQSYTFVH